MVCHVITSTALTETRFAGSAVACLSADRDLAATSTVAEALAGLRR
jgi:hypothetical protein